MSQPATINPRIVEALYCEALVLADEVRHAFDMSARPDDAAADPAAPDQDLARVALSCEALRTTTRMMHAVAWLLNHRAHFAGELSDVQVRRYGRLPADTPSDPDRAALLAPPIRSLIGASERFYARLSRIDRGWRERHSEAPGAVALLRERLGLAAAP